VQTMRLVAVGFLLVLARPEWPVQTADRGLVVLIPEHQFEVWLLHQNRRSYPVVCHSEGIV